MGLLTIRFKNLRIRWGCALAAAGFIVLFGYVPSWGHDARFHHESVSILVPEQMDTSLAEDGFLGKRGKKWKDLSPEEKKKYQEWQSLPPEEKEKIRRRMKRLNKMSPRERKAYQELYKKWRHLPPDERRQLEKELDNWENLSPRQQEAIRRRFMN